MHPWKGPLALRLHHPLQLLLLLLLLFAPAAAPAVLTAVQLLLPCSLAAAR
jgi:hypothetical protein